MIQEVFRLSADEAVFLLHFSFFNNISFFPCEYTTFNKTTTTHFNIVHSELFWGYYTRPVALYYIVKGDAETSGIMQDRSRSCLIHELPVLTEAGSLTDTRLNHCCDVYSWINTTFNLRKYQSIFGLNM